jgi:hypothetical protein
VEGEVDDGKRLFGDDPFGYDGQVSERFHDCGDRVGGELTGAKGRGGLGGRAPPVAGIDPEPLGILPGLVDPVERLRQSLLVEDREIGEGGVVVR